MHDTEDKHSLSGTGFLYFDEDETGIPQRVLIDPAKSKKKKCGVGWIPLWTEASGIGVSLMELAQNDSLTRTDYRILCWILSQIHHNNLLFLCHTHIAEDLKIQRANVSAAIKRLCQIGVLQKTGTKSGKINGYVLSPAFGFRGSLGEGAKLRRQEIKRFSQNSTIIPFPAAIAQ